VHRLQGGELSLADISTIEIFTASSKDIGVGANFFSKLKEKH